MGRPGAVSDEPNRADVPDNVRPGDVGVLVRARRIDRIVLVEDSEIASTLVFQDQRDMPIPASLGIAVNNDITLYGCV
jgi:hypothetical protein